MNKYYAGIGSRLSPKYILKMMSEIAMDLNRRGYILRSGGADGADKAFELGAGKEKEIFRPRHATSESIKLAMSIHPNPNACKPYVRKLHGRNMQIILGKNLNMPVEFVICWAKSENKGGTSMGIKIANGKNIPVYNLYRQKNIYKLYTRIQIK